MAQVDIKHYKGKKYNSLERFISYGYQIDSIEDLDVKSILEIGPGSFVVSSLLKKMGYEVTTADFDENVGADKVCDIRSLPFADNSFDVSMACQVLEHIPFEDFEKGILELKRVSSRYVIISLPRRHTGFNFIFKMPFIQTIFKKKFFDLSLLFPVKFPGFEESDQHYWEIDFWQTSLKDVKEKIKKHFKILKEFSPPLNKYHYFFVLEKYETR